MIVKEKENWERLLVLKFSEIFKSVWSCGCINVWVILYF